GLPEKLAPADIILVTHGHKDHLKDVTIHRLVDERTRVYAPEACRAILGESFIKVGPGDEFQTGGVTVRAGHAYNTPGGRSTRKLHQPGRGVSYSIQIQGKWIYHAGDTDVIPEMSQLADIDLAFLPIGGTCTMDMEEAGEAAMIIHPRRVVPIHRLKADPFTFKAMLESKTGDIEVVLPAIGEMIEV
ncbi:MAG: MBL fold metallo-hydrolase, partial [Thermodesulfobacteriota bacterium]